MKKYIVIIILALLAVSCNDFLDRTPDTSIENEYAFENPSDALAARNGLHNTLRHVAYYGKNMQVLGDIAADNLTKKDDTRNSSIYFNTIEQYYISASETEIGELWIMMYRACDRSARLVNGSKKILQDTSLNLTSAENRALHTYIAQGYAIKALSHFNLLNIFALPYTGTGQDDINLGVVIVADSSIGDKQPVSRATVNDVYDYIFKDLDSAKVHFAAGTITMDNNVYYKYFTHSACLALEARIRLYRKEYDKAIQAANNAISLRRAGASSMATSKEELIAGWQILDPSSEDIFILTNTVDENAGTASLTHFFRSYGLGLSPIAIGKYEDTDWRKDLIVELSQGNMATLKYYNSTLISKYPVFRLPEMYLIQAESYAMQDDIPNAQAALLNVAKRNPNIQTISDLPPSKEELLAFIADERVRELVGEGHRWFDLRRTGKLLNRPEGQSLRTITDYDVSKFCYPIPQTEVNATGLIQNDWTSNLP